MPTLEELLQSILLSEVDETAIKNKGIDKLPLNMTAQGWSGAAVRQAFAESITGNTSSVLKSLKEKLVLIKQVVESVSENTIELRVESNYIQWKTIESETWNNLISISDVVGSMILVQPEMPEGFPINGIWIVTNG